VSEAPSVNEPSGPRPAGNDWPALRDRWQEIPSPTRFDPSSPGYGAAIAAHDAAIENGQTGYRDPRSGLFVMTAAYLRDRGWCCDRGCRHCPYVGAGEASEESTT
jgi:hypothetical protein